MSRTLMYASLLGLALPAAALGQETSTYDLDADGRLSALVLYDDGGPFAALGPIYAMMLQNLMGHFPTVDGVAVPVSDYQAGMLTEFEVSFYVGSNYGQEFPAAFTDDFWTTDRPLVWMGYNLWQLGWANWNDFLAEFGFQHLQIRGNEGTGATPDFFRYVQYNGRELSKYAVVQPDSGQFINDPFVNELMLDSVSPPEILASIVHSGTGEAIPYVVRKGMLTHVADIPFTYIHEQDRYLAITDLMHDFLGIAHREDHRALFRLEDVHPNVLATDIRTVTDELKLGRVRPWGIALVPEYRDPLGYYNGGVGEQFTMNDTRARTWRTQIRRAMTYGAKLYLHGWTHQYGNVPNPYNGVTADDFEFWYVPGDAPIAEDTYEWFTGRVDTGSALVARQRWAIQGFEVPHYRASVLDYLATRDRYTTTWHRVVYYPYDVEYNGETLGSNDVFANPDVVADWAAANVSVPGDLWGGQFFPYVIHHDVYGQKVLPETMGNLEPPLFALGPQYVRLVDDLLANAEAGLVVRDGFASFFYHPYLIQFPELTGAGGRLELRRLIQGVEALGYTFVSPDSL